MAVAGEAPSPWRRRQETRTEGHPARRHRPAPRLGPAAAGAWPHAGRFRGSVNFRRLHDYRLARTRAALAELGPRRAAVLRPAQHPLHHQHGDRRVGARQADALFAAHAATATRTSGTSARAARHHKPVHAVAVQGPLPRRPARHARRGGRRRQAVSQRGARDQGAARRRGRRRHAARCRRGRGADDARAAKARHRRARCAADDAAGARGQEHRRADAAEPWPPRWSTACTTTSPRR